MAVIVWKLDLQYLCNQCLSSLMLWVWISTRVWCTILCDKVCQWLATGRWFSLDPLVSSTNKSDCHDITEILLKVVLNTIKQTNNIKFKAFIARLLCLIVNELPFLSMHFSVEIQYIGSNFLLFFHQVF